MHGVLFSPEDQRKIENKIKLMLIVFALHINFIYANIDLGSEYKYFFLLREKTAFSALCLLHCIAFIGIFIIRAVEELHIDMNMEYGIITNTA